MTTRPSVGTIELARGVYALIQEGGATNGGFLVGDNGVLVIEALMTTSLAKKTISEVRRVTNKPIRWLVLTHFHGDHTFGTEHFLPAAIVAHSECRDELIGKWESSIKRFSTNRPELAEEFRNVKLTPPDVVFAERLTLHLGSSRVELLYFGRAHTRGDVFIHLPQDRILFTGDVAVNQRVPAAVDGYIGSWITVAEKVQSLDVATVVPGHGLIGDRRMIRDVQAFFTELKRQARQMFDAGKSQEEAARSIQLPEYASWVGIDNLTIPVSRLYMEFRGEL